MICESCKFDNREGALYCAECGKPLAAANPDNEKTELRNEKDSSKTVILDEVVTNSKESVDNDDSEANTTVLTSDMLKPAQAAAPQGFAAAPVKPMAPQGAPMSPQPMAPQGAPQAPQAPKMAAPQGAPMAPQAPKMAAPQGAPMAPQAPKMAAPQGAPMAPQVPKMAAPQGAPMAPQAPKMAAPQGAPMGTQPQSMAPQNPVQSGPLTSAQAPAAPADDKKDAKKADKKVDKKAAKAEKKAAKGKMGTGTKVYIVISIILILGLGGFLAYGYFVYHTGKMEEAKTEKENLIADYDAQLSAKDSEIATLYASSTDAQTTISGLETQLTESQAAQAAAQATADSYVAYDPLIDFVESETADSSTDMMVSDTVVYTTVGSTVQVYVYFPSQEGQLSYTVSDIAVVDCTWGEEWVNGNVLPISINALSAGDVTIEVTNDQNDIKETIFVHVE